jgi:hypothetical protein
LRRGHIIINNKNNNILFISSNGLLAAAAAAAAVVVVVVAVSVVCGMILSNKYATNTIVRYKPLHLLDTTLFFFLVWTVVGSSSSCCWSATTTATKIASSYRQQKQQSQSPHFVAEDSEEDHPSSFSSSPFRYPDGESSDYHAARNYPKLFKTVQQLLPPNRKVVVVPVHPENTIPTRCTTTDFFIKSTKTTATTTATTLTTINVLRGGGGSSESSSIGIALSSFMKQRPFLSAIVITTVKAIAADLMTQFVWSKPNHHGSSGSGGTSTPTRVWDPRRTALFGTFGLVYQGCVQYAIVNWGWERLFPGNTHQAILLKVCGMNLISDPFLFLPMFYIFKQFFTRTTTNNRKKKGHNNVVSSWWAVVQDALVLYQSNWKTDVRNSWLVWFPGHVVTYGLMSPHNRIPWMAFLSFFYMCILSFTRGG